MRLSTSSMSRARLDMVTKRTRFSHDYNHRRRRRRHHHHHVVIINIIITIMCK